MSDIQGRPQLRMPTTKPDWIRQAQANDAQIREAINVVETTLSLAWSRYVQLLAERDRYAAQLIVRVDAPSMTTSEKRRINHVILVVSQRIMTVLTQIDEAQADLDQLRRNLRTS